MITKQSYQKVLTSVRSIIRLLSQKRKILILGPKQYIKHFENWLWSCLTLKEDVEWVLRS